MRNRISIYIEDALIIISICALWPKVFHFKGRYPDVLMGAALLVMVVVLFRRIKRLADLRRKQQEKGE